MSDICVEVEVTGASPKDWNLYYYYFNDDMEMGAAVAAATKVGPGLKAEIKGVYPQSRHWLTALSRVQADPILSEFKSLLFDKSIPDYHDHVEWVAHAPIDELRQWVSDESRSEREENDVYGNNSLVSRY